MTSEEEDAGKEIARLKRLLAEVRKAFNRECDEPQSAVAAAYGGLVQTPQG